MLSPFLVSIGAYLLTFLGNIAGLALYLRK